MRYFCLGLVLAYVLTPAFAQQKADGPVNEKAQKTYKQAFEYLHERRKDAALEEFKKADKQDGGHCVACQKQIIKYGLELQDWKATEFAAGEMVAEAQGDRDVALAHYQSAIVLMNEGMQRHKDEYFTRTRDEIAQALAAHANFPDALFVDGQALARAKKFSR